MGYTGFLIQAFHFHIKSAFFTKNHSRKYSTILHAAFYIFLQPLTDIFKNYTIPIRFSVYRNHALHPNAKINFLALVKLSCIESTLVRCDIK